MRRSWLGSREEEAIEVECWRDGKLVERSEPKGRVVAIDVWLGLDMGGVNVDKLAAELQHPVKKIIDGGERTSSIMVPHLHGQQG